MRRKNATLTSLNHSILGADDDWAPDIYFTAGYGATDALAQRGEWHVIYSPDGDWSLPFIIRPFGEIIDAASPYGYSGVYADSKMPPAQQSQLWNESLEVLGDLGVVSLFLRHSPLVPQAAMPNGTVTVVRNHETRLVPVSNLEQTWSDFKSECRTAVRKSLKLGNRVTIQVPSLDDVAAGSDFRTLYEETMKRRNAADHYFFPHEYYESLISNLADGLFLATVRNAAGTAISSALFMLHGNHAHYHLSGVSVEGMRTRAANLMMWEAMKHANSMGAEDLHLGGGMSSDTSLLRFKRTFGGRSASYHASGVVVRPQEYERLINGLGQRDSGPFPAYRFAE